MQDGLALGSRAQSFNRYSRTQAWMQARSVLKRCGGNSDRTLRGRGATSDLYVADPMLGPLTNNGGWTETHALLAGSPAIDATLNGSPNESPSTDQHRVARPQPLGGGGTTLARFHTPCLLCSCR